MNNSFQTPSLRHIWSDLDRTNGSTIVILRSTHLLTQRKIPSNVQWLNLWGEGVKKSEIFADVINGSPLGLRFFQATVSARPSEDDLKSE